MIIKALMTYPELGIKKNMIYDAQFPEDYKKSLCSQKYCIEIQADEVAEMPIDDYQEKTYPHNMIVFKDGNIYRANVGAGNETSATWIESEWTTKVNGN